MATSDFAGTSVRVDNYGPNHSDRSPFPAIWVNVFHHIFIFMDSEFPPVRWADSDVASCPEEKRCIGENAYKHCGPNPYILAGILFRFVMIADPTPILPESIIHSN
jgi:hypothetical protein